jgi:predicted nucleic acid-binding protein
MVFDSCVIIDALAGHSNAQEILRAAPVLMIAAVTRTEVLAAALDVDDEANIISLLNEFETIDTNALLADMAAGLRRKYKLKTVDSIILATSVSRQMTLVTRDKDFPLSLGDTILRYTLE